MNRPGAQPTTNAVEGLLWRRFRVAEVEQIAAAGVFLEDERFELIGAQTVPMHAKGERHEILKSAMTSYWARNFPSGLPFATETTFPLSSDTFLEPDFVSYPKAEGWERLTAKTALLVVEIADTSRGYDLGRKACLDTAFGIASRPRWRSRSPGLSCTERRSNDVGPISTAKRAQRCASRRGLSLSELIAKKAAHKSESGLACDAVSELDRRWTATDVGEAAIPHEPVPTRWSWKCPLDQA